MRASFTLVLLILAAAGDLRGQMVNGAGSVAVDKGSIEHAQASVDAFLTSDPAAATYVGGVKYLGGLGFPSFKGNETWDNALVIGQDSITAVFADSNLTPISFAISQCDDIRYGQAATRHVGRWVALGVLVAPIALLGLLHKSRSHYMTVNWHELDGRKRGMYVQLSKEQFAEVLNAVSHRCDRPVIADAKDGKWLFTKGVASQPLPEADDPPPPAVASSAASAPAAQVRKGMSTAEVEAVSGQPHATVTKGDIVTNQYADQQGTVEVDFMNDVAVAVRNVSAANAPSRLRKGLTLSEMEALAGPPLATAANERVVTNRYRWSGDVLEADFYDGILVAYRISSQ